MNDLLPCFEKLAHPRVLVLGDLILDRYTWGNADAVSREAPVLILKADGEEVQLGGAASVANLLNALEARVSLAGIVGKDTDGRVLTALLDDAGINREGVFLDGERPTPCKERFIGHAAHRHPHQILRVDHEECHPLSSEVESRLIAYLIDALAFHNVLLISDRAKGVCTHTLLATIISEARQLRIPVIVDPAHGVDYSRYRESTAIVPNQSEAERASGVTIQTAADGLQAGRFIHNKTGVKTVVVKLGKEGMALVQDGRPGRHFAAHRREVYDATRAGDMVLAMLGLCRGSGMFWSDCVQLANVAAGLEVERSGVVPVTRREVRSELERLCPHQLAKIVTLDELERIADRCRDQGKTVVFTNGCLDLLHLGHVTFLLEAAELGDVLIVAIHSDASVRRLKGNGRPLMNEDDRAIMLAALECVDYVLIFDSDNPDDVLRRIRPDVLVRGGTSTNVAGRAIVESYGGRVHLTGMMPGLTTDTIVHMIRDAYAVPRTTISDNPSTAGLNGFQVPMP